MTAKVVNQKFYPLFFPPFFFFVFSVGVGFSSEFEDEELASLRSPIPFRGSFARNKNAVAFSLFCFLSALRSELASLCSPIPFRDSFARNKNAVAFSLFCFLPAS